MFPVILNFASMLLAALLVGSMFGVWLVLNPAGLDAKFYVALQQQAIRALNKAMPILGATTILVTIAAAAFVPEDSMRFKLLIATVVCFVAAAFVTRFLNQPINAIVMTWKKDSPPAEWTEMRDQWWRWNFIRLAAGLAGLCLLIAATLRHG